MITGSDGFFSQGHFGKSTNTLVPDQSFMNIFPTNMVVVLNGTNSTNITFIAYPKGSSVSGRVLMGTNGISGIVVSNSLSDPFVTDTNGAFKMSELSTNASFTLTPDQTFVTVDPPFIAVTVDGTTNTSTNIVFHASPTIKVGMETNDTLPFVIGGGQSQALKVQQSFLLTNDWTDWTNVVTGTNNTATLVRSNISTTPTSLPARDDALTATLFSHFGSETIFLAPQSSLITEIHGEHNFRLYSH